MCLSKEGFIYHRSVSPVWTKYFSLQEQRKRMKNYVDNKFLLLYIKELDELLVCLSAIFPSKNKTMDLKLRYKYM